MNYRSLIQYSAIALIIVLILGLSGWYFFLRSQQSALGALGESRGFDSGVPSFSGSGGSTFENIISGLGFRSEEEPRSSLDAPRLWHVQATPTAGIGFIARATSTTLRLMERSTGYLYEADVRKGQVKRLTNTLVPKVYEASFSGDGSVIGRALNEQGVKTVFAGTLGSSSSTDGLVPLRETSLGTNLFDVVPSRTSREFISLIPEGNGATLIKSAWDGTSPQRLFSSRLRDWHIEWLRDGSIVLVQKPASSVQGSAYKLEKNGELTALVRGIPGLTLLPLTGSRTMLVAADNGAISMMTNLGNESPPLTLPVRTVADKCAWAPGSAPIAYCAVPASVSSPHFLDDWYQGRIHTSDSWWKINAASGTAELLYNPESEGKNLDVESPSVDDTGEYIAFINGRDKSAWMLRIKE